MIKKIAISHGGLVLITVLIVCAGCSRNETDFYPASLKCEHLVNPLGIDSKNPLLSWQMAGGAMGAAQSAFRIIAGTDSASVAAGKGNAWDSGKIKSGLNLAEYKGSPLEPFTRYFWAVAIWDERGKLSPMSRIASFETGMMDVKNWQGAWISDSRDIDVKYAPYFRKTFSIAGRVNSARIYVAVAGLYELYVNGKKVGNSMLEPAYTRFDRRTLYITHDVTDLLEEGENVIGILLGNGWYNHQSTAVWYFDEAPWRSRPMFCLDLRLTSDDGSFACISSNSNWKTSSGPLIFNSIYTGEHYDARLEQPGWNMAGFDDSGWTDAIPVAAPSRNIVAQAMHPIRITAEIEPILAKQVGPLTWLFDLGRNIAGISSLEVSGPGGTVVRMKQAERLNDKGLADQSNIDVHYRPTDDKDPFQTDILILSGRKNQFFMPRFNYKGFQYVEVTADKPVKLTPASLRGYFVHSDVPAIGSVTSSNPLLNRIWEAANNSYLSNLHGYPTDCPQREKNGWTGDAHIAIETGLYNFDAVTVYNKWMDDHLDEQQPNGVLPAIIPTSGWGYTWANGPDWTSTLAIIPWNVYLFYGDSRLLMKCYDGIKRYVDHINGESPDGLTSWGLGDWIPVRSVSPVELTSSVYYYTDALILAKAAKLFGLNDDHEYYSALADKIRDAINNKYLDRETGIYGSGFQTELCVPLHWGVVPEDLKVKVADNLADVVRKNKNQIDVGLLGSKAILNALSENGYHDLAYTLASRDSFPSWGWWIKNGATTLYENWTVDSKADISLNHIMFGEISAWMYKSLGGIYPDEENPGFKNVILRPKFAKDLEHFEARHEGPYGEIVSLWKRENGEIHYRVKIPANSTATLSLEAKEILESNEDINHNSYIESGRTKEGDLNLYLKSGEYDFRIIE